MSYGKAVKKNFYTSGGGDIAMPAENEIPPVLADTPQDWSGNQQQQVAHEPQQQEQQDEPEEHDDNDDVSQEPEEQEEVVVAKPKSKSAEENMARLREAKERAEREKDMMMSQMLEMQRQMQQNQQKQAPVIEQETNEDFDFSIDDDALLEGKHAKKLVQELKNVKKQLKQYHAQSSDMAIEAKIKANYPDFNDVCSSENIERLNAEFPEIAQTLKNTPDLYNKAVSAYSIMKRFGIYKDRSYDEDKMKAIKNSQKPKPLASVSPQQGDSPLSKANAFANGLTPDLRKQMLKEMAEARKQI